MKKLIGLLAAAVLCTGLLSGCGSKDAAGASMEMKEGQSVQTVVDQIAEDVGIAMAAPIDDEMLKQLFYIDPSDAQAYYGQISMANVSADNVVAIQAAPDKKDAVVEGLNKRLEDVQNSFAQYLPEQYEKAMKGRVVEKGNYVFLLILGQESSTFDQDMGKAVGILDAAF